MVGKSSHRGPGLFGWLRRLRDRDIALDPGTNSQAGPLLFLVETPIERQFLLSFCFAPHTAVGER